MANKDLRKYATLVHCSGSSQCFTVFERLLFWWTNQQLSHSRRRNFSSLKSLGTVGRFPKLRLCVSKCIGPLILYVSARLPLYPDLSKHLKIRDILSISVSRVRPFTAQANDVDESKSSVTGRRRLSNLSTDSLALTGLWSVCLAIFRQ